MSGGFPQGESLCNQVTYGITNASAIGVSVSTTTANTKGAWVQITASTTADIVRLVAILANSTSGDVSNVAVDIGIGASGSEVAIISNLIIGNGIINAGNIVAYEFPIQIPAGTRIAARAQSPTTGTACQASIIGYDGAFTQQEGSAGADAIGFVAASTQGTTITTGVAANTFGSFAQLVASTTRDYIGFVCAFDNLNLTPGSFASDDVYFINISVGASGSEKVIKTFLTVSASDGVSSWMDPDMAQFMALNIPAGTRIAAQVQSGGGGSLTIGLTIYGVYQ